MFSEEFTIKNPTGIHARPASQLVQFCNKIPARISFKYPKGEANPKSIISVLASGMTKGTKITVNVEGENEEKYGKEIIEFLNNLAE